MKNTSLLMLFALMFFMGCQDERRSAGLSTGSGTNNFKSLGWSKGDCIDRPLSPYIFQIADLEGKTAYLYPMEVMGKKVVEKKLSELIEGKSPFKKVPCP